MTRRNVVGKKKWLERVWLVANWPIVTETWFVAMHGKTKYCTEKLFISIFTIVFFNLGKNVSLWEFLLVKILNFKIMIWNFSMNYSKICYELLQESIMPQY